MDQISDAEETPEQPVAYAEWARRELSNHLPEDQRSQLGQFLTPAAVAHRMAGMFFQVPSEVRILDPGAGAGGLTAALTEVLLASGAPPKKILVTAFELDERVIPHLERTLARCAGFSERAGVRFEAEILHGDFLEAAVASLEGNLFSPPLGPFDLAILNPPYRKIRTASSERQMLRRIGVEVTNLYAAFVSLTVKLLARGGETVAILPRSFCNGP